MQKGRDIIIGVVTYHEEDGGIRIKRGFKGKILEILKMTELRILPPKLIKSSLLF